MRMPTMVHNYILGVAVHLESETAFAAWAYPLDSEVDTDLAGKETVTLIPALHLFPVLTTFGMIRGGHVDVAILGAMEVSDKGDLANWMIPGKRVKGMGGAMDIVNGVHRVIVMTEHNGPKAAPSSCASARCRSPARALFTSSSPSSVRSRLRLLASKSSSLLTALRARKSKSALARRCASSDSEELEALSS